MALGLGGVWRNTWIWGIVASAICFWIAVQLSAAPQNKSTHKTAAGNARPDILFVEAPLIRAGARASRFPEGSRIVRLQNGKTAPVSVSDEFFAAADPEVDFDAVKVLFSAQKTREDRWQIWEMDLDGANKRQITNCTENCLRGAYLPGNEIVLTVEDGRAEPTSSYIAVVKADGSQRRRVTFGPASFALETVLRDGRIVVSAPWPLKNAQNTDARMLYTSRPDGTALESFRCEHGPSGWQTEPAELNDGTLAFIGALRKQATAGGRLMEIVRGSATATLLGPSDAKYASPRQFSEKELLVSRARATGASAGSKFDLYLVSTKTGALTERIFSDPLLSSVQAVPVVPHERPKQFWSTLNPESSTGYFISLNSYVSADAPGGRFTKAIASVRVLTVSATDGQERSLGEAPVETDGSFYVQVPADAPIRFVLLDARGQVIREEQSWTWTRPGEQRGCSGCHGDKNVAPDNHWPMTLKRLDTPIALGETKNGSATSAAK